MDTKDLGSMEQVLEISIGSGPTQLNTLVNQLASASSDATQKAVEALLVQLRRLRQKPMRSFFTAKRRVRGVERRLKVVTSDLKAVANFGSAGSGFSATRSGGLCLLASHAFSSARLSVYAHGNR
ncbi:hypothetical protein O9929_14790 [Vibrio lentus]|nr:hypothetical protein [Vibrio lentus]